MFLQRFKNFAQTNCSISALVLNDTYSIDRELKRYPGIYKNHYLKWIGSIVILLTGILTLPMSFTAGLGAFYRDEYITVVISAAVFTAGRKRSRSG